MAKLASGKLEMIAGCARGDENSSSISAFPMTDSRQQAKICLTLLCRLVTTPYGQSIEPSGDPIFLDPKFQSPTPASNPFTRLAFTTLKGCRTRCLVGCRSTTFAAPGLL